LHDCVKALAEAFTGADIRFNEPMKNHTSFKTGGGARVFLAPVNKAEIIKSITICKRYGFPYYIMGCGTNLIVRDAGYEGLVIKITTAMGRMELLPGSRIRAGAGAALADVAAFAQTFALAGLEFAAGIPGSVGGAICMNAGAYGGEMKDVVSYAEIMDKDGKTAEYSNARLAFIYRGSVVKEKNLIAAEAVLQLNEGDKHAIGRRMAELNEKRRLSQPLDMPSAGSAFKRPEGHHAGRLIMDAGLKGYSIGGARVSEKHCGFIVNAGNATSADFINLIEHIQTTVKQKFGVYLEPEPRIIG